MPNHPPLTAPARPALVENHGRACIFRRNEHKHDRAWSEADGEDEELVELAELERLEAAGLLDDAPLDAPQQQDPRRDEP